MECWGNSVRLRSSARKLLWRAARNWPSIQFCCVLSIEGITRCWGCEFKNNSNHSKTGDSFETWLNKQRLKNIFKCSWSTKIAFNGCRRGINCAYSYFACKFEYQTQWQEVPRQCVDGSKHNWEEWWQRSFENNKNESANLHVLHVRSKFNALILLISYNKEVIK